MRLEDGINLLDTIAVLYSSSTSVRFSVSIHVKPPAFVVCSTERGMQSILAIVLAFSSVKLIPSNKWERDWAALREPSLLTRESMESEGGQLDSFLFLDRWNVGADVVDKGPCG